jgi:pilus assembly protein Flp/PilA
MLSYFQKLVNRRNEDGASAVEYGLLVAAIAAVIVVIVFALGGMIKGAFSQTCNAVGNGTSPTSSTASCN